MLDDRGREAMAAVAEQGHADALPDTALTPDPVSVTMRAEELYRKALGIAESRKPSCGSCAPP